MKDVMRDLRDGKIDIDALSLTAIRSVIDKADSAYYRPGSQALMADSVYDALKERLRTLCSDDDRLTRVGVPYSIKELRDKVQHQFPMGSLDNTDGGIAGYRSWYESRVAVLAVESADIFASLKIDGASVRARYEEGVLVMVATRGNGEVGENITANGANFINLPTTLPEKITCDVRGEAILYVNDFRRICEREHGRAFEDIPESQVSNPRNVGNGILGRDDGRDSHLIRFLAFNIISDTDYGTEAEKMEHLQELGFQTVPFRLCKNVNEVEDFYATTASSRDSLPFEIDGLVVVLNSISYQEYFVTSDIKSRLRPKYARAVKFPERGGVTVLDDVILSVGHTRAIIPTAVLREVRVGGVNVTHALLNNFDEIKRLDIAIGDEVEVVLSGDIIPKIVAKVKDGPNRKPIQEPRTCPACGEPATREHRRQYGAVTYCTNTDCSAAKLAKIDHWIGTSKKGVGILGIGDTILKALWDNEIIDDPADLYTLTPDDIKDVTLHGGGKIGMSRAQKIVVNIASKRELPLHIFLGSLGIELLGRRRVQLLQKEAAGRLDNLEDWLDDGKLAEIDLPGFGTTIREAVRHGIDENRLLIAKLLDNGVKVIGVKTPPTPTAGVSLPFSGLSFCLTGTRKHQDDIVRLGGEIKSGVSKKLDFLVQADPLSVSNKTKKAEEYGVRVISIDYLKRAIDGEVSLTQDTVESV